MAGMSLRSNLDSLASAFANAVLGAIRGASLEELLAESQGTPRRGPGRTRSGKAAPATAGAPRSRAGGRLARRSPADIAKALDQVIALVKAKKVGLRAEQ